MKKFFSLFAAALMVLSASAFTPVQRLDAPAKEGRQLNNFTKATPKFSKVVRLDENKLRAAAPARAAKATMEVFDATITIDNVTATTFDYSVVPTDKTVPYMIGYAPLDVFMAYDEAAIADQLKSQMDDMIDQYAMYGYDLTYEDFASVGDEADTFTGLDPETEYVVFAYVLDLTDGSAASEFASETATTEAIQQSENVITITYDAATETVNFSTTNNDPYFFYIEEKDEYEYYQSGYSSDEIIAELADWASLMEMYGVDPENYVLNGNFSLPIAQWNSKMASGDYVVMAAPYEGGIFNGTGAYCIFTYAKQPIVVTDTVAVTFLPYYNAQGQGGWNDQVAAGGWWQYQGITADESLYVSLSNIETTQAVGTYTIDDMDLEYTMIYDMFTDAEYGFESITVVVAENNGVITLTANGVCENGVYYIMTCNTVDATAVENVEDVKVVKTIENGNVVIIKNGVKFNAQGAKL